MDDRARLTVTDVVMVLVAVFAVTGLYPVFSTLFAETAPVMDATTTTIFQVLIPLAVVVLIAIIWAESTGGLT